MVVDYADLALTAHELLKEFGTVTTLTRASAGAYDPETGTTSETLTAVPVTAVAFPYDQEYIDGTLILSDDKQSYVSAVNLAPPTPGNTLLWKGAEYKVIGAKEWGPAGPEVLYELQLRR